MRGLWARLVVFAVAIPGAAWAQGAAAQPASAATTQPNAEAAAPESASWGLSLDLGVFSAYVFRGLNLLRTTSQWNLRPFAAPSVTYAIPKTNGLSVGYWGAYQLAGPNITEAIEAGLGAETDLLVTYSHALAGPVSGGLGFTAYIYPAASKDVAGTNVPVYVEPAIFASMASILDLGIKVAYFHGIQDAVGAYRYVYFNPTVGKTLTVTRRVSLALSGGMGYKLFVDRSTPTAQFNTVDVLVSAAVPVTVVGAFYVKPSVSWAWTNYPDRSAGEEMVVFGGVNLGVNL